jgi:hypothetical protein
MTISRTGNTGGVYDSLPSFVEGRVLVSPGRRWHRVRQRLALARLSWARGCAGLRLRHHRLQVTLLPLLLLFTQSRTKGWSVGCGASSTGLTPSHPPQQPYISARSPSLCPTSCSLGGLAREAREAREVREAREAREARRGLGGTDLIEDQGVFVVGWDGAIYRAAS